MEASDFRCRRLPVSVIFISTRNCNLFCEHCSISRFRDDELASSEVKAMVLDLLRFGVRSICFDGGEPLTRPDMGELISFCRETGMDTVLRTNGILLKERWPEITSLGKLVVSLFWQDNHPADRGVYENALSAIEKAMRHGLEVAASIPLTKSNISALPAIIADGCSLGVGMRFTKIERSGRLLDVSRISSNIPDEEELCRARWYLLEQKRKGLPVTGDLLDEHESPDGRLQDRPFIITPSGRVSPAA